MSHLDLDLLKQRWAAQSRELDAQLHLDLDAVRRRLGARTATALDRQRRSRLRALAASTVALAAVLAFMAAHRGDLPYLLLALPFVLLLLATGSVDLREWRVLREIDFAAPLARLRAQYDQLRQRRLQLVLAIAQLSVLLWLPLIFILMKGLTGVDLLRRFAFSVLAVNVGIGVVLVPLIALVVGWIARRRAGSDALRRFADEAAGSDWQRTSDHLDRQLAFEQAVQDGTPQRALQDVTPVLTPEAESLRVAARRRGNVEHVLAAVLILLSGIFNAKHGGMVTALVPGILLHLVLIGWLILAVVQHDALAPPVQIGGPSWRRRLQRALRGRRLLLQAYTVAAPLFALALLQVLGLALARVDLWQALGPALWLALGLAALTGSALLYRRRQRAPQRFAMRLADVLSLASLSRAQQLVDATAALEQTPQHGDPREGSA